MFERRSEANKYYRPFISDSRKNKIKPPLYSISSASLILIFSDPNLTELHFNFNVFNRFNTGKGGLDIGFSGLVRIGRQAAAHYYVPGG